MQLNEKAMMFLKNFASINPNIVFRGNETIKTMAEGRNIVAKATLETYPDKEIGIYDLSEFLSSLSLVDQPELEFKADHVIIANSSGRARTKYFFSDPEMLTSPTKDIKIPSEEVKFSLSEEVLTKLKKAAATLGHVELQVTGKDENIVELSVVDSENKTSNSFSIDVPGEFQTEDFKFIFTIGNLKLIPGDYDVSLSKKLIAHFKHTIESIEYWIALEKSSEYNE